MYKLLILLMFSISWGQDCNENMYWSDCSEPYGCSGDGGEVCNISLPYCDTECVSGCYCEEGYVFGDESYSFCVFEEYCSDGECSEIDGDLDNNLILNIIDVVIMIDCVINNSCNYCFDITYDYNVDIIDIIYLIDLILYLM